jgi:hypothetical protein
MGGGKETKGDTHDYKRLGAGKGGIGDVVNGMESNASRWQGGEKWSQDM